MTNPDINSLVASLVLECLSAKEQQYLEAVFKRFNGFPKLEQVWKLMDEPWVELGCDPLNMDELITAYYRHPVWVLNGLFIEQHAQSLKNRRVFTDWVVRQTPARVADFGGGFGGLARFIGKALPNAQVEVLEPHPHPAAIALATSTPNVRFVPELSGEYDLLIATDVFEHVPDPIGLAGETAGYLRDGGVYLIANCFEPIILCHLPQLFYLEICFDTAMRKMGLLPDERVSYGRSYKREAILNISAAREVATCGRRIYPFIKKVPRGRTRIGQSLVSLFCR